MVCSAVGLVVARRSGTPPPPPAPAAPPSAPSSPSAVGAVATATLPARIQGLRELVANSTHPAPVLAFLAELDVDRDPDAAQLRAVALTSLEAYPQRAEVAAALTEVALDRAAPRVERTLALELLRHQEGHLDRQRLTPLLSDTDPTIVTRARALLSEAANMGPSSERGQ